DQIEIAQTDVEIDDDSLLAHLRERSPYGSGGRSLSDASLARRHNQHFGHFLPPLTMGSVERRYPHDVAFKPRLRWSIAKSGVQLFCRLVIAVDCEKLGLDLLAVDPCGRIAIDARHGAAAERPVNMN